jgi:hypothetical protein
LTVESRANREAALYAVVMGMRRSRFLSFVVAVLLFAVAPSALADGWFTTGSSMRVKSVGPFTAKVYLIQHQVMDKDRVQKSKQSMIDADVDKRFFWFMQRDVDAPKIKDALRKAFAMNGYNDSAKIEQFVGAFGEGDVVEYDSKKHKGVPSVTINYDANKKTTSITVNGHGSASIPNDPEFGKAVWRIWFGKIDQPSMGDQLISAL